MREYAKNEYGVPQYPKGHTGRLLVTLAAISVLERPTATSVATLTGLSKSKVDDYVQRLRDELGVTINKTGPVYAINCWGDILKTGGATKLLAKVAPRIS